MSQLKSAQQEWWQLLYDEPLAESLFHREPARLEAEVDTIVRLLGLQPGDRVFDQCCGTGTLSLPLIDRGYDILGVDQCEAYINTAERATLRERARFHAADARYFHQSESCDAGFCWGTCYGNADEAGNHAMLCAAFETLKSGALYLVEFINIAKVLSHWQPCYSRHGQGQKIFRENRLNLVKGRLEQTWTIIQKDGSVVNRETSLALYLPHQLAANMEKAGFEEVKLFGDLGSEFGNHHHRILCLGRKP